MPTHVGLAMHFVWHASLVRPSSMFQFGYQLPAQKEEAVYDQASVGVVSGDGDGAGEGEGVAGIESTFFQQDHEFLLTLSAESQELNSVHVLLFMLYPTNLHSGLSKHACWHSLSVFPEPRLFLP